MRIACHTADEQKMLLMQVRDTHNRQTNKQYIYGNKKHTELNEAQNSNMSLYVLFWL